MEERAALRVAHDHRLILKPDRAPVAGQHPVLDHQGLAGLAAPGLRLPVHRLVLGMDALVEERGVGGPFLGRVPQDVLDARAHVQPFAGSLELRHVDDRRQLLQRPARTFCD